MKTIKRELTKVSHCQPQDRRKCPEQLNEGNPFFKHGYLSSVFSFKAVKIMEAIPSCTRTRNYTGFFGMPVNHTNCSHKLVKPKETALVNSDIYSSQNICS